MICRKKSGGHRASNKNIQRSSYCKVHQLDQLYISLSFDSVRTLEIPDVASATSCIACALEMRSSNGANVLKQLERNLKKSRLQRDLNPWPTRYQCDALPTELWSHTLGARPIYWVHISREEWNDAKYIWNNSYWTAVVDQSEEWSSINWPRSQCVAS